MEILSDRTTASALAWWHESGVDTIVGESPRDWLSPAAAPLARAPVRDSLPDTLAGFQSWLATTDDLPFAAPSARRVACSGDPAAGLMVLVDMPSEVDLAAGKLLAGDAGALFDRMLAAIGRSRETLYLAALSPLRSPSGRIDAEMERLAAIARHHVALAAPKALLMFGDSCAKALFGAPVAATRGKWLELSTAAGPIPALVTIRPEKLLSQPSLKRLAWNDLQLLAEGLK